MRKMVNLTIYLKSFVCLTCTSGCCTRSIANLNKTHKSNWKKDTSELAWEFLSFPQYQSNPVKVFCTPMGALRHELLIANSEVLFKTQKCCSRWDLNYRRTSKLPKWLGWGWKMTHICTPEGFKSPFKSPTSPREINSVRMGLKKM